MRKTKEEKQAEMEENADREAREQREKQEKLEKVKPNPSSVNHFIHSFFNKVIISLTITIKY